MDLNESSVPTSQDVQAATRQVRGSNVFKHAVEVVNLVGSVASITGVTLLWISEIVGDLPAHWWLQAVPIMLVTSCIAIAIAGLLLFELPRAVWRYFLSTLPRSLSVLLFLLVFGVTSLIAFQILYFIYSLAASEIKMIS